MSNTLEPSPVAPRDPAPVPASGAEPADDSIVLRLVDVEKEYGGTPPVRAVKGVSFDVHRGELVAIEGTSGSGKSTLLNIIGTLDRPTSGYVEIDGRRVDQLSQAQISGLRAGRIGFVFQQFHLLEALSALDNVGNGLIYAGIGRKQRRAAATVALERVGLAHRSHHRPGDLSGGERQRVAIARALIGDPTIVLADEPTGNLDSETSKRLIDLFRELHQQGATILIITHDRELAASLPRQITIRDGQVLSDTGSTISPSITHPDAPGAGPTSALDFGPDFGPDFAPYSPRDAVATDQASGWHAPNGPAIGGET